MARRGREEPEGLDDQPPADPVAVARELVLRALTRRAHTRQELADMLARKGVPEEAVREVLDRFTDLRLIDDTSFAASWVESGSRRLKGAQALKQELRRKGVDDETIADALENRAVESEFDAAVRLASKRLAASRGLDPTVRYRRAMGALARAGFSSGIAYRALKAALDAEGSADDDLTEPSAGADVE